MHGNSSDAAGRAARAASEPDRIRWSAVRDSLTQPYSVSVSMVVLVSLVPCYIFIADLIPKRAMHVPALAVDRLVPLQPAWTLVYAPLYLFAIMLPVFVVRQPEQIRRTVRAYLFVWITAFVFFLAYPTMASRPLKVIGEGFAVWSLRFLYSLDPPYNCFPSLHVAHSFVSALTCYRVHRGVGIAAGIAASLIGISTLFTRQHYIADVASGTVLAFVAYMVFLHGYRRDALPELERRLAPVLTLAIIGFIGLVLGGFWIAYWVTGK
jgi:membrane-associated phospholipid phosphatase